MDSKELIRFLVEWKPADSQSMESEEGISRMLTEAVIDAQKHFEGMEQDLLQIDKTYIREILAGYKRALDERHRFNWGPILDFMLWVVEQPDSRPRDPYLPIEGEIQIGYG